MPILISVVICTYNRADLLAGVLQTLCEQSLSRTQYEIIIVDNNSTDDTRAATEEFYRRYPNVRYCFEPRQGLSHARNRGWQEAGGEYVAYTDDDCKVPEQWLAVAKEIIEQISPAVFGGPYYAFYNTPKPCWFKDTYGSHDQGNEARVLTEREYLDGGNIFFRRALLEILGGFDPTLGMTGHEIAYGEETALLRRIRANMPEQLIYYEPRSYVYHLVPARKMSMRWIMRERFVDGRYYCRVLRGYTHQAVGLPLLLSQAARTLLAFGVDLVRAILQRDEKRYPYVQHYLCEHTFRYLQTLGKLYEQYKRIVHSPENRSSRADVS